MPEMSEQGRYFGISTWVGRVGRGRWPTVQPHRGFKYVKGFRTFISRGNLIDLAVAVVIGTAFTTVVTAIVADLFTPLIAAVAGKPNFATLTFTVNHSTFLYGSFINALLSFLIVAAVVYYVIVAPMAKITARFKKDVEVTTRDCPECLSTIPIAASRCMYCTSAVAPVGHQPPPAPAVRRPPNGPIQPWQGGSHRR
jgi:large conductance mechanosensitive channel